MKGWIKTEFMDWQWRPIYECPVCYWQTVVPGARCLSCRTELGRDRK